jgi:SAM-dependent methyltransferase
VHPVAAAGFSAAADVYERARPSYPQEAVDWIAERARLGPGRTVVDVGAGTGKLTRLLVPTGARVIAVEPLAEMRAKLEAVVPAAQALDGTAESIPLADGAADAVTAAQAFHWFEPERAFPELHRVLADDGLLVLIWNTRDLEDPLQRQIEDLIEPRRGEVIMQESMEWRPPLERSALFGEIEERAFRHQQWMTAAALVDRVASTSFIAAMPDGDRQPLLERVRALVGDRREPFPFPYRTDVFLIPRSSDRPSNGRGTSFQG